MKKLENLLSNLIREYVSFFKISYAILYQPYKEKNPLLILRFSIIEPEEKLRLLLDFTTILPLISIDVYDIQSLPNDIKQLVFRHGKVIYLEDHNVYLEDFKHIVRISTTSS